MSLIHGSCNSANFAEDLIGMHVHRAAQGDFEQVFFRLLKGQGEVEQIGFKVLVGILPILPRWGSNIPQCPI